jgi:type I restriction enzyme S subunit
VDKHSIDGEVPVRLCNYVDVYKNDRITADLTFMNATATPSEIERFKIAAGDVLITKDSETPNDIAVAALVDQSAEGIVCGYHLALLRPNLNWVYGTFLFWSLKGASSVAQFSARAQGVTRFGLTTASIGDVLVAVPSLAEQRAIAAFLDRECGRIDTLIEEQERLIMLLLQKRERMIDRMVSYKEDGSPWPMISAKWICRFEAGLHIQPEDLSFDPIGDRYIRTHEVGVFQRNKNPLYVPVCPKDAIVLRPEDGIICFDGFINSKGTGTIGLVRWGFDGILGPHLNKITAQKGVDPRYPKYALSTYEAHRFILSAARGAVAQSASYASSDISVPMLPLEIQNKICDILDRECGRIDALTAEAETMISLLRERRSALISAAVTGQIDVRTLAEYS